ncbi:MAG: hypothetical protein EBS55_12155, partial [Flavobacteriaceae bacterium]|nr:hypothetical protein [Flavobacteriaceae bacterium]
SFSETAAGRAFSKARTGTALGGKPNGGMIGGLVRGGMAALGAEGGFAAIGGALATGGAYIAAAVLAVKGLDSAIQAFNGSSEKTAETLGLADEAQKKYGVSLSDTQKRLLERFSESTAVSGTGISGFYNRNFGTFFGGEQQNALVKQLGKTGLQESGNQALSNFIGTANIPQIEQRLKQQQFEKYQKEGKNIPFENIKINPEEVLNELKVKQTQILKQAQDAIIKNQQERTRKQLAEFDKQNPSLSNRTEEGLLIDTGAEAQAKRAQRANIANLLNSKEIQNASDLFQEIEKLLADSNIQAKNLNAQAKEFTESFLYSTQYLQKQLETYQQIEKINASRMTGEEAELEIRRQLLSTTESQKSLDEFRLKTLQQEKNTRAEIRDTILSAGRSQISTFIQNRGNQVTDQQAQGIIDNFTTNLQSAGDSIQEIQNAFDKFVVSLNEAGQNDTWVKNLQYQGKILVESVKTIKAQNEATKYQNALEAQNKAIIEQQNYQYSIQKEFLQARINAAQKELDIRKELRDVENTKQNLNLERSLFNVPERLASRERTQLQIAQEFKNK